MGYNQRSAGMTPEQMARVKDLAECIATNLGGITITKQEDYSKICRICLYLGIIVGITDNDNA